MVQPRMLLLSCLATFLFVSQPAAQQPLPLKKYWVEFTDKNNSPYCTCRPAELLSARALERRARAGVVVTEEDLPVNPAYLDALRRQGAVVHNASRWLNAAAVVADSATAAGLSALPFVRRVEYLGPHLRFRHLPDRAPKKREAADGFLRLLWRAAQSGLVNTLTKIKVEPPINDGRDKKEQQKKARKREKGK